MKLIYFSTIEDLNDFKKPTEIITRADAIVCLKKHEDGSWLNGQWVSKNINLYQIWLSDGHFYDIDEANYNKIINELKNA